MTSGWPAALPVAIVGTTIAATPWIILLVAIETLTRLLRLNGGVGTTLDGQIILTIL
jgi:hypothetical protein